MEHLEMMQLMQLADSALPLGGFAFSNGLEWMVKTGAIQSVPHFESYLQGLVHQVAHFDVPFLRGFSGDQSHQALEEYHAMVYMPAQRAFSITQGRAWLRLLPQIYPQFQVAELRLELRDWGLPPHFLYVLGRSMTALGSTLESLATLYVFMLLRDQISAALRLGICGPGLSQQLLSHSLPMAQDALKLSYGLDYDSAVRTSVIMDIAQAGHQSLYSKLFQN
ncbi:MAG: hypothetical protein PF447_13980 [Spirochaetaceae bacterium]|jgi:urease accessory protein|nr:hypothetical protein [Spirochaetaceae bacterium]